MTILHRCLNFLNQQKVAFHHTTHPHAYSATEVASVERLPAASFAKTIVFKGDFRFGMAVLPADCIIDLDQLKTCLDFEEVRLATELELAELFPGCELGAMPPLGVLFGLPVFVDERLAREEFICFNACTHRDSIHMSFTDFARVTRPILLRFAQPLAHAR